MQSVFRGEARGLRVGDYEFFKANTVGVGVCGSAVSSPSRVWGSAPV